MGMNFKVGLFDHPDMFWAVVAVIALVAPITLGAAKHRNWI
jgi:Mg2+ and Co2+ transporter CorA